MVFLNIGHNGHITETPFDVKAMMSEWKKEDKVLADRLKNAVLLSKNVKPPKSIFYWSYGSDPEYINKKFEQPLEEIFVCPHCHEKYYPEDYDGYYGDYPLLPTICIYCDKRMNINPIIRAYGDWAVTLYGIESINKHIYFISQKRLFQKSYNWLTHMNGKYWVNIENFAKAYEFARLFFNIQDAKKVKRKILPEKSKRISYKKYLKSDHWQKTRLRALRFYGGSCVLCGKKTQLNVHHRNYKNLGKERISKDLIVLCQGCHEMFHKNIK
ncbi:MAG TPA: hypothetical protein VMZ91_13370 [Candidatus Paceibacterota bacterium]|nr:hypothetical protein [Candidatus Paceibacterota bacterium]